jgi:hypothetical protein
MRLTSIQFLSIDESQHRWRYQRMVQETGIGSCPIKIKSAVTGSLATGCVNTVRFAAGAVILFSAITSRPALGPTQQPPLR